MTTTIDPTHRWVDAAPFRAHLHFLMGTTGLSATQVSTLAGVPQIAVNRLLTGRTGRPLRRLNPETARRLIQLTPGMVDDLHRRLTPAHRARGQLDRLRRSEPDLATIAVEAGVSLTEIQALDSGAGHCSLWLTLQLTVAARARARRHVTMTRPARLAA